MPSKSTSDSAADVFESLGAPAARTITKDESHSRSRISDNAALGRSGITSLHTASWEEQRRVLSDDADRRSEMARKHRKRAAQFAALLHEEEDDRCAIEKVFHESIKAAATKLRHEFQSRTVPRLSQLPRLIACGSPTALVHKQLRAEKMEQRTAASLDGFTADGERGALLLRNSVGGMDQQEVSPSRNAVEVSRLSELRRTLHHTILQASASASRALDEEGTSWVSVGVASAVRNKGALCNTEVTAAQTIQRVGRGFLLRASRGAGSAAGADRQPTAAERRNNGGFSKKHRQKSRNSPAAEQKPSLKARQELETLYCCSAPRTANTNVSSGSHRTQREASGTEKAARAASSTAAAALISVEPGASATADCHTDSDACLSRRGEEMTPPLPPPATSKNSIQRRLREVEMEIKRRVEQLDLKTKRSQQLQDVKMRALAMEEEKSRERHTQMMRALREESRVARLHDREADLRRAEALNISLQNVRREFDIKRVEAHVELRQTYMLEDRVSALRKTLSELANVSHLAATVPSLNLTKALKDAHFAAEGLSYQSNVEDP